MLLKILTFLALSSNAYSQIMIDNETMIHYDNTYNNDYRFSNSINQNYIINNSNNITECKYKCAFDDGCVGVYENIDDNYCNTLSNLGTIEKVNEKSNSYTKIVHRRYSIDNHSLDGIVWDSNMFYGLYDHTNLTIYLDINHNGELDDGEPSTISNDNRFSFDNITEGTYLVRQILPDNCIQFYPGLNGSFEIFGSNINGDGYIDKAIRYHHKHNSNIESPYGGYINSTDLITNSNFSFIIGNNTDTYLSFYPDDSIILVFLDDSIINEKGNDLIIKSWGISNTSANISISHDNVNFEYLGILNGSFEINEYDLETINYNISINYIKLDFIGENLNEPLNIINIGIENRSIYLPPFSYNIQIPYDGILLFLNDCNYKFSCDLYCDLNLLNDNDYISCSQGCDTFTENNNCNCTNIVIDDDDYYSDFVMNIPKCEYGCQYAFQKHIFPNYTLIFNSDGDNSAKIDNNRCDINCIDNLINKCNGLEECKALSISDDIYGNLYDNYEHHYRKGSQFIIKNSYFDTTSSTTTSITTSSTTTSITSSTTTSITSSTTTSITSSTTSSITSSTTTSITTSSTTTSMTSSTTTSITTSSTTTSMTSSTTTSMTSSTTTSNVYINTINSNKFNLTKNNIIVIAVSVSCTILIIIIITALFKSYNKKHRVNNAPSFSMNNPVYDESLENNEQIENYQELDINYKVDYNNDYMIVSES